MSKKQNFIHKKALCIDEPHDYEKMNHPDIKTATYPVTAEDAVDGMIVKAEFAGSYEGETPTFGLVEHLFDFVCIDCGGSLDFNIELQEFNEPEGSNHSRCKTERVLCPTL